LDQQLPGQFFKDIIRAMIQITFCKTIGSLPVISEGSWSLFDQFTTGGYSKIFEKI
jgi:hypothetical protein